MSAFMALRDVSNNFENELRQLSSELFSAKVGEKFEDAISKKIRDMKLYSSKLKLLRAKTLALTPQIKDQQHHNTLQDYGDAATWKIIEYMTVKSFTETHAVKALITTPDRNLDPKFIEKKEAIVKGLLQYNHKEDQLRNLNAILKEREAEHAALRTEWDKILGVLKESIESRNSQGFANRGPLYKNLAKVVDKLEQMRWLIGRLICVRGNYDWLTDPHHRLSASTLTRIPNTVDMFTQY